MSCNSILGAEPGVSSNSILTGSRLQLLELGGASAESQQVEEEEGADQAREKKHNWSSLHYAAADDN